MRYTLTGAGPLDDVTVDGLSTGQQYHFLGNPFPNAFDINGVNLTDRGFQAAVQVWEPGTTVREQQDGTTVEGSYRVILPVSGLGSNPDDDLAAHQGFLAERSSLTAGGETSVTFSAEAQVPTRPVFSKRGGVGDRQVPKSQRGSRAGEGSEQPRATGVPFAVQFTLDATTETGTVVRRDRAAWLFFHPDANAGWDVWDASKLQPLTGSYAAVAFGAAPSTANLRAVASFPLRDARPVQVPMRIQAQTDTPRRYDLSWRASQKWPEGWAPTLVVGDRRVDLRTRSSVRIPRSLVQSSSSATAAQAEPRRLGRPLSAAASKTAPPPIRLQVRRASSPTERRGATARTEEGVRMTVRPNPIRDAAEVRVVSGTAGPLSLQLIDVLGRRVATLHRGQVRANTPTTIRMSAGSLAAGVYLLRAEVGGTVITKKVVLAP